MGGALIQQDWYPYKKKRNQAQRKRLCEDTVRRQLSVSLGGRPQEKLTWPAT